MAAITEVKCRINSVQIFLKYRGTDKNPNKWVLLYGGGDFWEVNSVQATFNGATLVMCVVQVFNVKRRLSYIRHNTPRIGSDNAASREPVLAQNWEFI